MDAERLVWEEIFGCGCVEQVGLLRSVVKRCEQHKACTTYDEWHNAVTAASLAGVPDPNERQTDE